MITCKMLLQVRSITFMCSQIYISRFFLVKAYLVLIGIDNINSLYMSLNCSIHHVFTQLIFSLPLTGDFDILFRFFDANFAIFRFQFAI